MRHHKAIIPIIDSRDTFDIDVWEDSTQGKNLNSVLKVFCQEKHPTMDAIEEKLLFLDPTSRSQGVILKIEYCNVAMMQYHTTERSFRLESSLNRQGRWDLCLEPLNNKNVSYGDNPETPYTMPLRHTPRRSPV